MWVIGWGGVRPAGGHRRGGGDRRTPGRWWRPRAWEAVRTGCVKPLPRTAFLLGYRAGSDSGRGSCIPRVPRRRLCPYPRWPPGSGGRASAKPGYAVGGVWESSTRPRCGRGAAARWGPTWPAVAPGRCGGTAWRSRISARGWPVRAGSRDAVGELVWWMPARLLRHASAKVQVMTTFPNYVPDHFQKVERTGNNFAPEAVVMGEEVEWPALKEIVNIFSGS